MLVGPGCSSLSGLVGEESNVRGWVEGQGAESGSVVAVVLGLSEMIS